MAETPFGSGGGPSTNPGRYSSNNEYLHNDGSENHRNGGVAGNGRRDKSEEEEEEEDQQETEYNGTPQERDFYAILNVPQDVNSPLPPTSFPKCLQKHPPYCN